MIIVVVPIQYLWKRVHSKKNFHLKILYKKVGNLTDTNIKYRFLFTYKWYITAEQYKFWNRCEVGLENWTSKERIKIPTYQSYIEDMPQPCRCVPLHWSVYLTCWFSTGMLHTYNLQAFSAASDYTGHIYNDKFIWIINSTVCYNINNFIIFVESIVHSIHVQLQTTAPNHHPVVWKQMC